MMDWGERGEHMTTGGWVFMVFGMLFMIALLAILVMWILSQQRRHDARPPSPGMSAREVLDHRLVTGEVTPDVYDQLRDKLDEKGSPSGGDPPKPPHTG